MDCPKTVYGAENTNLPGSVSAEITGNRPVEGLSEENPGYIFDLPLTGRIRKDSGITAPVPIVIPGDRDATGTHEYSSETPYGPETGAPAIDGDLGCVVTAVIPRNWQVSQNPEIRPAYSPDSPETGAGAEDRYVICPVSIVVP